MPTNKDNADREHIFPASIGGKRTLPIGSICKDCNHKLGQKVDSYLKKSNSFAMYANQKNPNILGKRRNAKDKMRKKNEKRVVEHSDQGIICNGVQEVSFYDIKGGTIGDFTFNIKFSAALHKCAINSVCCEKDSEYIIHHYSSLKKFIQNPTKKNAIGFPFAVCYANLFSSVSFEPHVIKLFEFDGVIQAVALLFDFAIYIVGLNKDALNKDIVSGISESIEQSGHGIDFLNQYDHNKSNEKIILDENQISRTSMIGNNLKFCFVKGV